MLISALAGRKRHQYTRNIFLGGMIKCICNTAAVFGNWTNYSKNLSKNQGRNLEKAHV